MTDSILDEFDDERPAYRFGRDIRVSATPIHAQRSRFMGRMCCGRAVSTGKPCRRIGMNVRDGHSYCEFHDPGPEAA